MSDLCVACDKPIRKRYIQGRLFPPAYYWEHLSWLANLTHKAVAR